MIVEHPVTELLELETYNPVIDSWQPWIGDANRIDVQRGGKRNGVATTVEVGTLTATLVNAGDPLVSGDLEPNLPIRLVEVPQPGQDREPVFTGRINDLDTTYVLDKDSGKLTTYVTISAVDSVAAHANTIRYGAVVENGVGYESWAKRITRLASSSLTDIEAPDDDTPIVRYAI